MFVIRYIIKNLNVTRQTEHSFGDFETVAMLKDRSNTLECGLRTELGIVGWGKCEMDMKC